METVDRAISELVATAALLVEARMDKELGRRSNYYTVIRISPDSDYPPPQKQDTPLVTGDEQNENQENES